VQDAAYSSLLKQDRRTLHKLAADTLLSLYPERRRELAAVIAFHFERAGDVAAAAEHFVVAGDHALERFANREALAFFDRAEANLAPDDPRLELRMRAALGGARVGWTYRGADQAIAGLERAIAAGEDRADPKLLGELYFWVAFLRRARGESPQTSPELRHAVERAAAIGAALGDPVAQAIPNAFMAVGMMFGGELRQGARELEAALDILVARADAVSSTILAGLLGIGYARVGDFTSAERALALAGRLASNGDPISALDVNIGRSALLVERGDVQEGAALATKCAMESEELGAVACGVSANVFAGAAYLASDDDVGAKPPLERGAELAHVSSMAAFQTLAEGMLGSVRARLGDIPAGTAGWNIALERAHAMHDRYGEAMTLWQRARTRARATPPDHGAALADLDAATKLFDEMEARPALARALRDRAQTLRDLGLVSEADTVDERSRSIGAELGLKDFAR
jgi:tetratricopeptide (TPR) repeat protein